MTFSNAPTISMSRRNLIAGLAAAGSWSALSGGARAASRPNLIDLHYHFRGGGAGGVRQRTADLVADMDKNGIAVGMGYPGPVQTANIAEGRALARRLNERGAETVRDDPRRFGLMASLPMLDEEGSLAEIAYALDVLKADGFSVNTQYGTYWLGDPRFERIFEELSRHKAAVFVHPVDAACCTPATMSYETAPVMGAWLEWPMNTARTMMSMMLNRTINRNPDIRMIFAHGGGVMPLLISRMVAFNEWGAVAPEGPAKLLEMFPAGIEAEYAKFYVELAQAYAPENLYAIRRLMPRSHIVFGTDRGAFEFQHAVRQFREADLPADIRREISYENALALFPRVRSLWTA